MNPGEPPSAGDLPDGALVAGKTGRRILRMLVVYDDPHVRTLIAANLQRDGHDVQSASNSEWGLALHSQQRFDAVVVDLVMLGMDGLAMGKAIKQRNPKTPVILVTAHDPKLEDSPFDLILRKPFPHYVLRAALDRLCSP